MSLYHVFNNKHYSIPSFKLLRRWETFIMALNCRVCETDLEWVKTSWAEMINLLWAGLRQPLLKNSLFTVCSRSFWLTKVESQGTSWKKAIKSVWAACSLWTTANVWNTLFMSSDIGTSLDRTVENNTFLVIKIKKVKSDFAK